MQMLRTLILVINDESVDAAVIINGDIRTCDICGEEVRCYLDVDTGEETVCLTDLDNGLRSGKLALIES